MIVDSHAHAWASWPYEPAVPDPGTRGTVEQLIWEMDRHGIDGAVIIAARIEHNPDNNAYVADAVTRHASRLHMFCDVDSRWSPEYHTAGASLRLRAAVDQFGCKGFTHYLGPTNDGWLRTAEGGEFFETAAELNLVASLAGPPVWQADLREVAKRTPTLPILCHHLAGLASWNGDRDWALQAVLASADVPNILIKASGFYYGSGTPWEYPHPNAIAAFKTLHEAFGSKRLCWGSDHPVLQLRAMTYRQSLEIVRSHCSFLSEEERSWILGQTLDSVLRTARPFR